MARPVSMDFTNVQEGGGSFRKTRYPAGDYLGKITKVQDAKSKEDKKPMWLFTIEVKAGKYPYYCKFQENQLWKIRNLFVAAGVTVPRKKVKVDPSKIIGRNIGVTLDDDEYDGKAQSVVAAVFPPSELDADAGDEDDDEEEETSDDEDEEEDEEESGDEEDEDEDDDSDSDDEEEDEDEEEEEEPEPPKKTKKAAKAKPAPAKAKKSKKVADDDDLEEIDIEDM